MSHDPTPSPDGRDDESRSESSYDPSGTGPSASGPQEQPLGGVVESGDLRSSSSAVTLEELPVLFRVIDRLVNGVLVVGFAVLLFVIAYNVFGRMIFGGGAAWADEGARFLFIWLSFLGAGVAYFRREHIAVSFLVDKLPPPARMVAFIIQELLVLGVLGLLMWGAFELITTTGRASPLLGIPMSWWFFAVPTSALLMALMAVYRIGRLIVTREV